MHILFVHQNFPAQFGHIAEYLISKHGIRCAFVSEKPAGTVAGIERIQYETKGGATKKSHFCSRTFENQVWHSHGVYSALAARKDIQPDLIVGHSGFVSTLFLRELYDCPVVNYFEFFYHTRNSDIDFRNDLPQVQAIDRLRAQTRNAMLLLDLHNCDAGYAPTGWQHAQLPPEYRSKIEVIFDGIDTRLWHPAANPRREYAGRTIPPGTRVVTYVSRGMESVRGFDIFMKVAKRVCQHREDVLFLVVGEDRVSYGGDRSFTGGKTFKEWVLEQDDYDLSRIWFLGRLPAKQLAELLTLSDLHIYLTVPFVLSWSLMNALACGATVLVSDTPPVQEMIQHERNGLLVDFFDVEAFVKQTNRVLDDPTTFQGLGQAGIEMIAEQYSLDKCLPKMLQFYERVVSQDSRLS